ncbi:thiamine pyrophosphokinase [Bacteroidia bacterium]|nr:thiamine pyrophosphokinase [Bacteroidia bacterium]
MVIILANGAFPTNPQLLKMLKEATTIICCDGAVENLLFFGKEPDFIVGDLDSIHPITEKRFFDRIIHISEQESNDLTKAVNFCKSRGYNHISILGATGKRPDHTLGNISLLAEYINIVDDVRMYDDFGVFTAIKQSTKFNCLPGQVVSVFSLTPETPISYKFLEYPIEKRPLTSWWQGTLNRSLSTEFEIIFSEGKVIVFQGF